MFSKVFQKVLPYAKKGIQKIANSKLTKEIGSTLLYQGVSAVSDIAENVIEGKSGYSPIEDAKKRLQDSRKEIADVIRKRSKESDESESEPIIPKKKRKKVAIKLRGKQKKKRRKYSLYEDFEDV